MGGRNPDRIPRLRSLKDTPPGWIRLGICRGCGRRDALPIAKLLARYGELFPTERALFALQCSKRGERKMEAVVLVNAALPEYKHCSPVRDCPCRRLLIDAWSRRIGQGYRTSSREPPERATRQCAAAEPHGFFTVLMPSAVQRPRCRQSDTSDALFRDGVLTPVAVPAVASTPGT